MGLLGRCRRQIWNLGVAMGIGRVASPSGGFWAVLRAELGSWVASRWAMGLDLVRSERSSRVWDTWRRRRVVSWAGLVAARGVGGCLGRGLCSLEQHGYWWSPLAVERQIGAAMAVEAAAVHVVQGLGWRPQRSVLGNPDLLFGLLLCAFVYLYLYFAYLFSVIRVVSTHCVLIMWRIRLIFVCPVKRALWIPRMVFVTPMWPELGFGAPFLREFMPLGSLFMPLGSFFFPIWYLDTLQEIMFYKRIITVVGGFGPQSLVGDPVLVVYSLGVFCNFNGFVSLFDGTSLFRDLYVLLIELLSAVMDFVQFKD